MKTRTVWVALALVVSAWCAGGVERACAAEPAKTAAEGLTKKMALVFDRNAFETTMEIISEEIGVPIVFLGADLQAEGITRHKALGLDEPEQPAGELIRKIFKKVELDDKLIYVIKPKEGVETIFITTRAAAAARGDKIPAEFAQAKPNAKPTGKPASKPAVKPPVKPKKN